MFPWFKRWLGRKAIDRPFPAAWGAILDRNVPLARVLPEADRRALERLVLAFVDDKHFEGGGGLVMTDEIRVTIAAHACIMLLHRDTDLYPDLVAIVVYPSTFVAPTTRHEGPVVIEEETARLGESWERGVLVLAWDAVQSAASSHGQNVVVHEFAHQLDQEDGTMDGAPDLQTRARYMHWERVLGREYAELVARVDVGGETLIDEYGATSPPEFFAVVTEMFFEAPRELRARHPELYETLSNFFRQDPASYATSERAP
jgi:Mlc titration factor MtfA (ptsG expression regulator)